MVVNPRAIIADDEEELRIYMKALLAKVWPELDIYAEAKNGLEALELIESTKPDIAFLDIKMPGLSGMQVAKKIIGSCRIVFITAYDQYAVEAFERKAIDYLLKPVSLERLEMTIERLKEKIRTDFIAPADLSEVIEKLLEKMPEKNEPDYLKWVRAQHGDTIRLIAVKDVCYFKASEKYTQVVTIDGEVLINKPIKKLADELNPDYFWRIHRGTIVNAAHIAKVSRSLTGRFVIKLKNISDLLTVSRRYSYLFKQM